jgi:hypothetical protein
MVEDISHGVGCLARPAPPTISSKNCAAPEGTRFSGIAYPGLTFWAAIVPPFVFKPRPLRRRMFLSHLYSPDVPACARSIACTPKWNRGRKEPEFSAPAARNSASHRLGIRHILASAHAPQGRARPREPDRSCSLRILRRRRARVLLRRVRRESSSPGMTFQGGHYGGHPGPVEQSHHLLRPA